jgi:uncharacterized damage-inducible protein DinB
MTSLQPPPVQNARQLTDALERNTQIIARQVAGLSHSDSLIQPPVRGNCLNWVLGHIAVHRDFMLEALCLDRVLDDAAKARYDRGSAPILGEDEGVLTLDTLLEAINEAQRRLAQALGRATEGDLNLPAPGSEPSTVAEHVSFLHWHETYHLGQTEFLRQLAGTDDQVI